MQQGSQQPDKPMFDDFQRPEGAGQQGQPRPSAPPGQQTGYSQTVYQGPNVTSTYKPYQSPQDKKREEEQRKFEEDAYLKQRQEAQAKRNKIIIVAVCIVALVLILAIIGVIVVVVITYSEPATLENINVSPDFDDLKWGVSGYVELAESGYALEDIKITVSGSAVTQSTSKNLFEIQWPANEVDDPSQKQVVGSHLGFFLEAPMKATVKGSPTVSVGLSIDGAKVETVEIDVSRYYSEGKI